jgi:signal transduction histidine kinase
MPHREIDDAATLRRVLDAMLLIEGDLDLPVLLSHVVEEARSMTNARYGALGVLNEDRTGLAEFITIGLGPAEVGEIGALPTGKGLLGVLIAEPVPLRVARIDSHPDSYGFPPGHPPMASFLGVPIKARGEVYGNLYLTDKVGWSEFTTQDEALVGALAVAAGIAIENARLHQRVQKVAVYDERDRVARDLHDTVIQRLFAAGLRLQGIAGVVREADIAKRMDRVITEIDESITQLRSVIYALGLAGGEQDIRAEIISLLRDLADVVGFQVHSSFDGPVGMSISDEVGEHLLSTVREAVTNIGRHARATQATVRVSVDTDHCQLTVTDNGLGMHTGKTREGGLGLANMRRRAEKLRGSFDAESPATGGTILTWRVPIREEGRTGKA